MVSEDRFTTGYYNMMTQTRLDLPRFIESELVTEAAEDWSRVRSPSRAMRRMRRGFPQNVRYYRKPACYFNKAENVFYIHPELMKALREEASKKIDRQLMRDLSMGITGIFA